MEKMANYKRRIDRISAQIGAAADGPRTVADIVRWTTEREQAAGGTLTPEDRALSNYYFRRLFAEAEARESAAGGRPGFGAKPSRRRE